MPGTGGSERCWGAGGHGQGPPRRSRSPPWCRLPGRPQVGQDDNEFPQPLQPDRVFRMSPASFFTSCCWKCFPASYQSPSCDDERALQVTRVVPLPRLQALNLHLPSKPCLSGKQWALPSQGPSLLLAPGLSESGQRSFTGSWRLRAMGPCPPISMKPGCSLSRHPDQASPCLRGR